MSRKPRAPAKFSNVRKDDAEEELSDNVPEDDGDFETRDAKAKGKGRAPRDEDELDVVRILQDYQKKKDAKIKTRGAAFQRKKDALYAAAREDAVDLVQEARAYMDGALEHIDALRSQEVSFEGRLEKLEQNWKREAETSDAFLSQYRPALEDLARKRGEEINDASAMLEAHSSERSKSYRQIRRNAKDYVLEGQKNKSLAVDASAYIKHFKALILS